MPKDSIWSIGGIGNSQLKMNAMALLEGVRVGLEDKFSMIKKGLSRPPTSSS